MTRFTQLVTILAILSLGMGLSQALHHAVAHATPAGPGETCSGHCGATPVATSSHDQLPDDGPDHDPDHCAVCATIAGAKSLVPALLVSGPAELPVAGCITSTDETAPRAASPLALRSRAPPIR